MVRLAFQKKILLILLLVVLTSLLNLPAVTVRAGISPIVNLGNLVPDPTQRAFAVDSGIIAWVGTDGGIDLEIFFYDTSSGDTKQIRRITNNAYADGRPQVDSGVITWQGLVDEDDAEIFCYDLSSNVTTQITNNIYNDLSPQVDSGIITWSGYDGNDDEIFFYDTSSGDTTQITNNIYNDLSPQVDSGIITWRQNTPNGDYAYFYDVSSDDFRMIPGFQNPSYPQVDSGIITCQGFDELPLLYFYNVSSGTGSAIQLDRNDDSNQQVDSGIIAWQDTDGRNVPEIFFYDTSSGDTKQIRRITNNAYADGRPQVDSGVITWQGLVDEDDAEIFCYDLSSNVTTQITNNGWSDLYPQIDSGIITWWGHRADGDWIFFVYLDRTPPVTTSSIVRTHTSTENPWYISDVTINLTAIDVESKVGKINYSLDSGATWTVVDNYTTSFNLSTEGSNAIHFYSCDKARPLNNEAVNIQTILIDKTLPIITPTSLWTNGSEIKESSYEIGWSGDDSVSGIDHYEARLDSETWTNIADLTTYRFESLGDGSHIVAIKAVDKAGNSKILARNVIINTSPIGGPGLLEEGLLGAAGAGAAVGAVLLMKRRKPKEPPVPGPESLRITVDPAELVSDGKSTATITVELLDAEGKPVQAQKDSELRLFTTLGKITTPVMIQKGQAVGKSLLTSSTEFGEAKVSATSKGLKQASVSLQFVEKRRFCMHCGTRMSREINLCPKCARAPPSGVDVKACPACGEINPAVAKFCGHCGASQYSPT